MKAVVDTNVVISGIFFGGVPRKILELAHQRGFSMVVSHEMLTEYAAVVDRVAAKYPRVQGRQILEAVVAIAEVSLSVALGQPITADPTDDKFFAAALGAGAKRIVSGDKHLKDVSGWSGIEVFSPAAFLALVRQTRK
jgi:uncharacterized protein